MAIKKNLQSGLTLVEVMVVVAIFAIVSGVLFFNFNDFNTNVTLRNLSQETALTIRKAQTYATGIQKLDGIELNSSAFSAYGMSFSPDTTTTAFAPNQKTFVLFADSGAGNRLYANAGVCGNPSTTNECVESFTINTPEKIARLCTDAGCITSGTVNVVFKRPSPDAEICVVTSGNCNSLRSFLRIELESTRGTMRSVTIWNTGQISVN